VEKFTARAVAHFIWAEEMEGITASKDEFDNMTVSLIGIFLY